MLIKVCGMRDAANISGACEIAPDFMGFIFYPKSPRYAGGILSSEMMGSIPSDIIRTGVFVNEEESVILATAKEYSLDAIQLHGGESPQLCERIRSQGFTVLKALHLDSVEKVTETHLFQDVCDYLLFDTPSVNYGGTGISFDWSLLEYYHGHCPFFLSGGIGPGDEARLKQITHPQLAGVDVNSKFEVEPGIKNLQALQLFVEKVRGKQG